MHWFNFNQTQNIWKNPLKEHAGTYVFDENNLDGYNNYHVKKKDKWTQSVQKSIGRGELPLDKV